MLLDQGCDGITLFGTTGEGPEFSVEDRIAALAGLISAGIEPGRLIVSVSALAMADVVTLSAHATDGRSGRRIADAALRLPLRNER